MNTDLAYQLLSIFGTLIVFFLFIEVVFSMKYSFYNIIVNFIKWLFCKIVLRKDYPQYLEPIEWLSKHTGFIGAVMIVIGHFYSLIALVMQLRLGTYHNEPTAYFISSPLNQFGLILLWVNPVITFVKNKFIKHSKNG